MSIRTGRNEWAFFHIACAVTLGMLLVSSWGQEAPQTAAKRKIPCKTPENVALCYWAHGRLSAYNGNPTLRLWKIGTHRILGIYSGPDAEKRDELDNEHPEIPANVRRVFKPFSNQVFADFEICPLEPERLGEMQAVCIESAKNIFAED
jgi:hypothetical protein